jgi:hypothetical protein
MWEQDPVPMAIYARDNNLLETEGWMLSGMKKMAKIQHRIVRQVSQSELHPFVPFSFQQAMELI